MSSFDLVTGVFVRSVAWAIEEAAAIGRTHGFRVPLEYDVGCKVEPLHSFHGRLLRFSVRMNEIRHAFTIQVPDASAPRSTYEKDNETFLGRLASESATVVHLWIEHHPESRPNAEHSALVLGQMGTLDGPTREGWIADVTTRLRKHMHGVRFTVVS